MSILANIIKIGKDNIKVINTTSIKFIILKLISNKRLLIVICIDIIKIWNKIIKKYTFTEVKLDKNLKSELKKDKLKINVNKCGPISFNRKISNNRPYRKNIRKRDFLKEYILM